MRWIPLLLLMLSGCGKPVDAHGVDVGAIHVAIADALIEARRPPDLPNDFENNLHQNGDGEWKRPEPLAHEATPRPSVEDDSGYCPRLVIYTAPEWCEPCRKLDKELDRLKSMTINGDKPWRGLIGTGNGNAIEVIDASCADSPETHQAKAAGVETWPTIIRLGKDGNESSRTSGVMTAEQLSQYQAGRWSPPKAKSTITGKQAGDGIHVHHCPTCSTEWAHGGGAAGDVVSHSCPRCGKVQWDEAYFGPLRTTSQPARNGLFGRVLR